MKHIVLDVDIILDNWLKQGDYLLIENLFERCRERDVKVWFPASVLGELDSIFVKQLVQEGKSAREAKEISRQLLSTLLEDVSLLSCFGFDQSKAVRKAYNLKEAQIALATSSIHGEKRLVTYNKNFDTLGLIEIIEPVKALEWISREDEDKPIPFIDLKAQQDIIRPEIEKNIHTVLKHGRYILGPEIKELEEKLCQYTQAKHCIGVSSGTDALLMPLMAWNIGPGDAVFTTPFTFIATAEVIRLVGATPVFVDIDPHTFNIDPEKLDLAITAVKENDSSIYPLPKSEPLNPKVIIPVDLFGLPADYDPIMKIAEQHDLKVLSDSAQGFGSVYKGRKSGTLGHATATSFFPAKPLGGYGDSGAIFTDDDALAEELYSIRVHGKGIDQYDNIRIGLNARLDTLQAAVLLAKLEIFEWELEQKQALAEKYNNLLEQKNDDFQIPHIPHGLQSAWAQYSVLAKDKQQRSSIMASLKAIGLPSRIYYAQPLHIQTAFAALKYKDEDFPIAKNISKRIFSLPMHAYINRYIIQKIEHALVTYFDN